jgi:hypothetical protein
MSLALPASLGEEIMKPARRDRNYTRTETVYREPVYPKPTVPDLTKVEQARKPIKNLDVKKMRALTHNAVMWCDHEGGTVLGKSSNPFSALLDMENRGGNVEARFWFQTSPYSNGSLGAYVWYKGELVFAAADVPGPVYQYPSTNIKVSTYVPGAWEKFLTSKGYHKTDK